MYRPVRRALLAMTLSLVATSLSTTTAHAKQYAQWSQAVPVEAVNSAATEGCPIEAPDGQSLYIMSTRGAGDDQDIWVATRDRSGELGAPEMLPAPVNSDANDFCPTPLRGGSLLFVSNRGGVDALDRPACGGGDIYVTRRSPATGDWAAPRNLGCTAQGGPNGSGTEFGPSVVETDAGTLLFYSTGGFPFNGTQELMMSHMRPDGTFGPGEPVRELNSSADDMMPNVRKDGREIVFASSRPGRGGFDIWTATRSSTSDLWSDPVNLGPAVNGPGSETRPALSWHGTRLYFGRAGEIYVSTR